MSNPGGRCRTPPLYAGGKVEYNVRREGCTPWRQLYHNEGWLTGMSDFEAGRAHEALSRRVMELAQQAEAMMSRIGILEAAGLLASVEALRGELEAVRATIDAARSAATEAAAEAVEAAADAAEAAAEAVEAAEAEVEAEPAADIAPEPEGESVAEIAPNRSHLLHRRIG